ACAPAPDEHPVTNSTPQRPHSRCPEMPLMRVRGQTCAGCAARRSHLGDDGQNHWPTPSPFVHERIQRVTDLADQVANIRLAALVGFDCRRNALTRLLE